MTYTHYAVVSETCPVCSQGRVLVASEGAGGDLFVFCEDCESEWCGPQDSRDASLATRDKHPFSRYLEPEDLVGHQWCARVLNR